VGKGKETAPERNTDSRADQMLRGEREQNGEGGGCGGAVELEGIELFGGLGRRG
jgi:hypothetical protein